MEMKNLQKHLQEVNNNHPLAESLSLWSPLITMSLLDYSM
jgi:hypothetical protein